uniref:Kinesin motor domain-containing protein n=1 Tax=Lactuca sativa TaxID=4236 RepID=A0A9R1XWQ3_LACSA|nr:hypothetical protein LSAT_V11C100006720 [Lactuca sativa]
MLLVSKLFLMLLQSSGQKLHPADINAEETLNTLKYANTTQNIQNKPVVSLSYMLEIATWFHLFAYYRKNIKVNRDPVSSEMLRMRQQLECLQAELCARGGGSTVELQVNEVKGKDVVCLIKNSATLSVVSFMENCRLISTWGVRNKIFAKIENIEVGCPHFSSSM